jgi:APA family basic amino acid/polyamine antiporter
MGPCWMLAQPAAATENPVVTPPALVRGLGPIAATSIVVGSVIGTGIFLKTRVMMCNVESPALVIAAWIVAGLLTLAGALTYAERAAMMPRAGGEYVFIREGYGRPLAFLYGWTQFAVAYSGGQAAKGVGFAIFLNGLAGGSLDYPLFTIELLGRSIPFGPLQATALAVIILATLVNCLAISVGGRISVVLTSLKVIIVLGIGVGAFLFARGSWGHFSMSGAAAACAGVETTARGGLAGFGAALLGALWAYDGWTNGSILAGEVRDPQRSLPAALIGGTLLVGALYVFANVSYLFVLSPIDIGNIDQSSSVAAEVVRQFLGPAAAAAIAVAMMVSTLGTLHTGTMAGARVSYAMARDGLFFGSLARISGGTRVPVNALLLQCAWSCVLALSGSYDRLTDYVIFAAWIFYALNAAAVMLLRRRQPAADRPYRTPGYPIVPCLFILAAAALVANTLTATPRQALAGLGIILLGVPVYAYWRQRLSPADV